MGAAAQGGARGEVARAEAAVVAGAAREREPSSLLCIGPLLRMTNAAFRENVRESGECSPEAVGRVQPTRRARLLDSETLCVISYWMQV